MPMRSQRTKTGVQSSYKQQKHLQAMKGLRLRPFHGSLRDFLGRGLLTLLLRDNWFEDIPNVFKLHKALLIHGEQGLNGSLSQWLIARIHLALKAIWQEHFTHTHTFMSKNLYAKFGASLYVVLPFVCNVTETLLFHAV